MWNKDKKDDEVPAQPRQSERDGTPRRDRSVPTAPAAEQATIGQSIEIRGEVTGDEDLVIQGHVDGSIELEEHAVTVGPDGEVKASILGRVITVEGRVEGDLSAGEQIILRSSARVEGDIEAPRVMLEDGARFRGSVEMGDVSEREKRTNGATPSKSRKSTKSTAAGDEASGTKSAEAIGASASSSDNGSKASEKTAEAVA